MQSPAPSPSTTPSAPTQNVHIGSPAGYLTPTGFLFPYGDYFRMAIDSQGKLHAAWGETSAYVNAGTIWVANR